MEPEEFLLIESFGPGLGGAGTLDPAQSQPRSDRAAEKQYGIAGPPGGTG